MADKDKKIDPYDVVALEKSLNDSATRVSTIWVSFLTFSLYLLTASTTATHRQLFLAEPLKLPVLNIDLPLWGFFFLAPILFVILHVYVLIQVILLARTAAAYSAALNKIAERGNLTLEESTALRQRLANTLFAQIFAGSPREREGAFGWLLNAMAWITLAISPILILLAFQFMFLPYHSHGASWTHRLLILLEFVVAFQLWPLVLNPQRDVHWPHWSELIRKTVERLRSMLRPGGRWTRVWQGLRRRTIPLGAGLMFVLLSLWFASFPGEWHVNLFAGQPLDAVQCSRWLHRNLGWADLRVDRLNLPRVDVVDDEKLDKIEKATDRTGKHPYQGERTRLLRDRNFNCANFSEFADLRRIDLSGAHLRDADLRNAKLQGSSLERAQLRGADLDEAELQGASLNRAQLQGAKLDSAQLQGATLDLAQFQGAVLSRAELQGASLRVAQLQGASLYEARLQGASLDRAQLQGAELDRAQLQGASLYEARLQGASLKRAQLQGASLISTDLQGAEFDNADLAQAEFSGVRIWRASGANCTDARVVNPQPKAVIEGDKPIPTTYEDLRKLVADWMSAFPEGKDKDQLSEALSKRLTLDPSNDDTAVHANVWLQCAKASSSIQKKDFDETRVVLLRGLVCDASENGPVIGMRIATTIHARFSRELGAKLARTLLGEDGKPCAAANGYDTQTKQLLRAAAGPPPPEPAGAPKQIPLAPPK